MPDDTVEAWRNIIERLRTIDQPLQGYRSCLEQGMGKGLMAARRQVATAIEQGRVASGSESGFDELVGRFASVRTENPASGR